jgi:serine protease Do
VRIEVEVGAGAGGAASVDLGAGRGGPAPDDIPPMFPPLLRVRPGRGHAVAGPQHGVGSGFIIGRLGDIVTNRHVVQGATKVTVTMNDGKEYSARVVGKDAQTDVAVVRLEKPPATWRRAPRRLRQARRRASGSWPWAARSVSSRPSRRAS